MSAAEAARSFKMPPGFKVTVFASEPDVRQPIAMTFDPRGRLWVAENYTYAEAKVRFDTNLSDRVLIFEDTNHDGHFDKRTVFYDRAKVLTSVEVGFGGVFLLCPPHLLFIPDRNHDDIPDGEPEVLLDGFERHRRQPSHLRQRPQMGTGRLALGPRRHLQHGAHWPARHARSRTRADERRHLALPSHAPHRRSRLPRHHESLGQRLERARRTVLHQHRHRPSLARDSGRALQAHVRRRREPAHLRLDRSARRSLPLGHRGRLDEIARGGGWQCLRGGQRFAGRRPRAHRPDDLPGRQLAGGISRQAVHAQFSRSPHQRRPPRTPGLRLRRQARAGFSDRGRSVVPRH